MLRRKHVGAQAEVCLALLQALSQAGRRILPEGNGDAGILLSKGTEQLRHKIAAQGLNEGKADAALFRGVGRNQAAPQFQLPQSFFHIPEEFPALSGKFQLLFAAVKELYAKFCFKLGNGTAEGRLGNGNCL